MSAGRESGREGCASVVSVSFSSTIVGVCGDFSLDYWSGVERLMARVLLRMSVKPFEAVAPAVVTSFCAVS